MLKQTGLVVYIGLLEANKNLLISLEDEGGKLLTLTLNSSMSSIVVDRLVNERLVPVFNDYFRQGLAASQDLVEKQIAYVADPLNMPRKYNRQVLDEINRINVGPQRTIFRGYADSQYKTVFTRREVDRLKRTILSATYENAEEEVLRSRLQTNFNLTRRSSQLLARGETKRLREGVKLIYFKDPEVQKEYDLVWDAINDSVVRPTHLAMDGKKADVNGLFDGGVGPPPFEGSPWNCRCSCELIKKNSTIS